MPVISFDDLPDAPAKGGITFDDLPDAPKEGASPAASVSFDDLPSVMLPSADASGRNPPRGSAKPEFQADEASAELPQLAYPPLGPGDTMPAGETVAGPDSSLPASFAAEAAAFTLNSAAFVASPKEPTSSEYLSSAQAEFGKRQQGLQAFDDSVKRRGYSTADDDQTRTSILRSIDEIKGKLAVAGRPGLAADPTLDASRIMRNKAGSDNAAFLRESAESSWEAYGATPNAMNPAAQVGRGAGMFFASLPAMLTSGPAGIAQMAGASYEDAYGRKEKELRGDGLTDETEIAAKAGSEATAAAVKTAPQLALYMVGGKLAGSVASKAIGEGATVLQKTLSSFAGATVANVGAGSVLRALEAPEGQKLDAAIPKVENLTADTLFAVFHAAGEYGQASRQQGETIQAQARAKQELMRRGFSADEIDAGAEHIAGSPSDALVPQDAATAAASALVDRAAESNLPETAAALRESATPKPAGNEPPAEPPAAEVNPKNEPVKAEPAQTPETHELDLLNDLENLPHEPVAAPEQAPEIDAAPVDEARPDAPQLRAGEDQGDLLQTGVDTKTHEQIEAERLSADEDAAQLQREQDVRVGAAKPLRAGEDIRPERDMFEPDPAGDDLFDFKPDVEAETEPKLTADEEAELRAEWEEMRNASQADQMADLDEAMGHGHELLEAVKKVGGLPSLERDKSLTGETRRLWETSRGKMMKLANRSQRLSIDGVREALEQYGFRFDTPSALIEALEQRLATKKTSYGFEPGSQTDLFRSTAPKTPEHTLLEKIRVAAAKAPTEAQLDETGRQPASIDFDRPSGTGKISVQNTREALTRLADRYRAPSDSSHLQRVADTIKSLSEKMPGGVLSRVLRNEGDLPARVRADLNPRHVHEGIIDTTNGRAYFFADNIRSAERAAEVFAHEVVGHYGVEKLVGETEWQRIADTVLRTAPEEAGKIARQYVGKDAVGSLSKEERALVAREYVARLAEKPAMNPRAWQRVVQAVRNALRKLGIRREWSEADIRDLILRSAKSMEAKGDSRMVGNGDVLASVRELPDDVRASSPHAEKIEQAYNSALPDREQRAAVDHHVADVLAGGEPEPLSGRAGVVADRFVKYFRDKRAAAEEAGVSVAADAGYQAKLTASPNLDLVERLAVYSSEVNRAISERATGQATSQPDRTKSPAEEQSAAPAQQPRNSQESPVSSPDPATMPRDGQSGGPTSIKNAVVDRERAARGLPPMMTEARLTNPEVWDSSMRAIDADGDLPKNLVDELEKNPRAATPEESMILLHRRVTLRNERNAVGEDVIRAHEAGDAAMVQEKRLRGAYISDELQRLENVSKKAGTEQGRALQIRKVMANEDYTLASLESQKRVANDGKPLSEIPGAQEEVEKTAQAHKEAQARVEGAEKAADLNNATAVAQDQLEEVVKSVKPARKKVERVPNAPGEVDAPAARTKSWIERKADAARARIKERGPRLTAGLDPVDLADRVIVGAADIAGGLTDFAGWASKQVREWGEKIAPHLQDIWDRSNAMLAGHRTAAEITETMADRAAEGATLSDLRFHVRKLAEAFVRNGTTDLDPLLDEMHPAIEEVLPGTTRRQVMDAFSGYGEFRLLSKDAIDVQVRDLKGQAQQEAKIEDMIAGQAPKKTGGERRTPSAKESAKVKIVNEMKKLGGYKVTDPATQLRTALDAQERGLSNAIRDIATEIETGDKRPDKGASPTNDRNESLRGLLARLKQTREEVFGSKNAEMTDAQRLKLATAAADRMADEYERQVREEDFSKKKGKPTLTSPEHEVAKARRDSAKAARDELRLLDQDFLDAQDLAREKRGLAGVKARTAAKTAELKAKIAAGDYSRKPPRKVVTLDAEALAAKADLKRIENEFQRGLIKDRLSKRNTFERTLDGAAKWRRTFVLSGIHTIAKLASAATEIIGIAPLEEAAGGVIGKLPLARRISEAAPRHGSLSLRAESEAITANVTNLFRDLGDYIKKGGTDLDEVYGDAHLYPFEWKEYIGRLHGALKTPARRNEWTRSFRKRMDFAARQGADITDPLVQTKIGLDAYKDANKSIFMESNMLVDGYKRWLSRFEQIDKATGKPSTGGKVAATASKIILPVVRIPTNIVARTFEYTLGSATGSARLAGAFARGIENLHPEQADLIMQNLKRGSVGLAVLALGYFNADSVGGYYHGKRDDKDVKPGELRMFGKDVPKFLIHNPLLEQLQIGATIRRVADSKLRKKDRDPQGPVAGAIAAGLGVLEEVPFVGQGIRTAQAFEPGKAQDFAGDLAAGMVVPQGVQEVAKFFDKKSNGETVRRKPESFMDHFSSRIPGARETLKESRPKR